MPFMERFRKEPWRNKLFTWRRALVMLLLMGFILFVSGAAMRLPCIHIHQNMSDSSSTTLACVTGLHENGSVFLKHPPPPGKRLATHSPTHPTTSSSSCWGYQTGSPHSSPRCLVRVNATDSWMPLCLLTFQENKNVSRSCEMICTGSSRRTVPGRHLTSRSALTHPTQRRSGHRLQGVSHACLKYRSLFANFVALFWIMYLANKRRQAVKKD
ncbi:hypothetical protein O3P69_012130 [Scylla paramamosain]|uniref:Uncharacterized protein n=1 Tax=Scylla paramamosain TaxID=85552 RepID=A0AAW0TCR7_SCYPA